jgi:hypothetical protein
VTAAITRPACWASPRNSVVDAWFDCMTTPGPQRWQSVALCFLVELPLAGLCLWLSYHTHQIAERRILLLRRRRR